MTLSFRDHYNGPERPVAQTSKHTLAGKYSTGQENARNLSYSNIQLKTKPWWWFFSSSLLLNPCVWEVFLLVLSVPNLSCWRRGKPWFMAQGIGLRCFWNISDGRNGFQLQWTECTIPTLFYLNNCWIARSAFLFCSSSEQVNNGKQKENQHLQ